MGTTLALVRANDSESGPHFRTSRGYGKNVTKKRIVCSNPANRLDFASGGAISCRMAELRGKLELAEVVAICDHLSFLLGR